MRKGLNFRGPLSRGGEGVTKITPKGRYLYQHSNCDWPLNYLIGLYKAGLKSRRFLCDWLGVYKGRHNKAYKRKYHNFFYYIFFMISYFIFHIASLAKLTKKSFFWKIPQKLTLGVTLPTTCLIPFLFLLPYMMTNIPIKQKYRSFYIPYHLKPALLRSALKGPDLIFSWVQNKRGAVY